MVVLHGTWVAGVPERSAWFAVWAEQRAGRARSLRRTGTVRGPGPTTSRVLLHPFAARPPALTETVRALCGRDAADTGRSWDVFAHLPSAGGHPLPSPGLAATLSDGETPAAEVPVLAQWRLPALRFDATTAARVLLALAALESSRALQLGDDLRFWITATRLTLDLIHRQRFLPTLEREDEHPDTGHAARHRARWRPLVDDGPDHERLIALAATMPAICRALAAAPDAPPPGPRGLLRGYVAALVDGVARSAKRGARVNAGPASKRTIAAAWWNALFEAYGAVEAQPERLRAFEDQLRAWTTPSGDRAAETFRLCLRLDPPDATPKAAPSGDQPQWTVQYLLQATDDPSLLVPAAEAWRQRGATARFLNRRLDNPQERLLADLGRAARLFPPIEPSLRHPRPETATLSTADAHRFVAEAAVVLKAAGFGILVPSLDSELRLRLRLKSPPSTPGDPARSAGVAAFTWDTLIAYDWEVALGDQRLTRAEFEQLARLKQPLVQVRGRWVELHPEQIDQALAFFRGGLAAGDAGSGLSLQDALRLALAPASDVDRTGLPVETVEADGWLDDLLQELRGPRGPHRPRRRTLAEPAGFKGKLRPYQKVGVAWLSTLDRYGLGACLADDMGLGKTVQLIALLLQDRASTQKSGRRAPHTAAPAAGEPSLLICPTSVVGNWQRELSRFAPSLRVLVHHGAGRARAQLAKDATRHDVVISTYALLHRDEAELSSVPWRRVVLDEAQNVKNASTKAAQAARRLPARWRAALTGTPVENRLSELWSLFQFLNPGYLGPAEAFRKRFANPIERAADEGATTQLKRLVAPFILRRLKTDRAIIQDLPEKLEMKVFCSLTGEQATLYEAIVRESLREIESAEGIQRRGQILATLTKLKQVCDHPALLLHDRSALEGRSGKLARLSEMLEEALAVDDRALIFTQYAEMGKLLKTALEARFGEEALFLHGAVPAAERDRMVTRFQRDDPHAPHLFILSLKAGGTGLNLTRANHVFHFDRWWNPAVENQATDRAFRIGQTRNVQVHKLMCAGTFEETLDALIERKSALSQAIVGTSEAWITEMSTAELRDLFTLRRTGGEALAA